MSDQEPGGVYFPSEDQEIEENRGTGSTGATGYDIPLVSDQLSLWLQNAPTFSSSSIGEAHEDYFSMLNEFPSFEVPSSFPSKQMIHSDVSCSGKNILTGFEKGQSSGSGTKQMQVFDSLEMVKKETDLQEDGPKEDLETSDGYKAKKRTRSSEVHNLNERLRRQKLKEKMKTLRELIPNCHKRDKASTLDDAIKYIKTLQHQVQMMSVGAGSSIFDSPLMMMQQQEQQRMQIPGSTTLHSFVQTYPPQHNTAGGMKYGIEIGTSSVVSSFNHPMNQLGLPDACLLPSSAFSWLPEPAHSVQDPGKFLEPSCTTNQRRI